MIEDLRPGSPTQGCGLRPGTGPGPHSGRRAAERHLCSQPPPAPASPPQLPSDRQDQMLGGAPVPGAAKDGDRCLRPLDGRNRQQWESGAFLKTSRTLSQRSLVHRPFAGGCRAWGSVMDHSWSLGLPVHAPAGTAPHGRERLCPLCCFKA